MLRFFSKPLFQSANKPSSFSTHNLSKDFHPKLPNKAYVITGGDENQRHEKYIELMDAEPFSNWKSYRSAEEIVMIFAENNYKFPETFEVAKKLAGDKQIESNYKFKINLSGKSTGDSNIKFGIIDVLFPVQAWGVIKGLKAEDVKPLYDFWQISALAELKQYGLRNHHLLNLNTSEPFFVDHCFALIELIRDRNYSIESALKTIEGLSSFQAEGIREGLERDEVILLDNLWQISALKQLKASGLTANHLQNLKIPNDFGYFHCGALVDLVRRRGHTVDSALKTITGLSENQIVGIDRGLERVDVERLDNLDQIYALAKTKNHSDKKKGSETEISQGFRP